MPGRSIFYNTGKNKKTPQTPEQYKIKKGAKVRYQRSSYGFDSLVYLA